MQLAIPAAMTHFDVTRFVLIPRIPHASKSAIGEPMHAKQAFHASSNQAIPSGEAGQDLPFGGEPREHRGGKCRDDGIEDEGAEPDIEDVAGAAERDGRKRL
jgi:hypothetical protein